MIVESKELWVDSIFSNKNPFYETSDCSVPGTESLGRASVQSKNWRSQRSQSMQGWLNIGTCKLLNEFLIISSQRPLHRKTRHNANGREDNQQDESQVIMRRILWAEEVRTPDVADLSHQVYDGCCAGTFFGRLAHGCCCPGVNECICGKCPGYV